MTNAVFCKNPCNDEENDVSLEQEPTNLENENSAQTTVANLRNITTRNGCTATLLFSEKVNPHIRREVVMPIDLMVRISTDDPVNVFAL